MLVAPAKDEVQQQRGRRAARVSRVMCQLGCPLGGHRWSVPVSSSPEHRASQLLLLLVQNKNHDGCQTQDGRRQSDSTIRRDESTCCDYSAGAGATVVMVMPVCTVSQSPFSH